MTFNDYVSYISSQHDEDPLYIFDEKVCSSILFTHLKLKYEILIEILFY